MRHLIRPVLTALGIACAAASFASVTTDPAMAQGAAPQIKQMALTQKQIDGVVAAQKEMDAAHREDAAERQAGSESDGPDRERRQEERLRQLRRILSR